MKRLSAIATRLWVTLNDAIATDERYALERELMASEITAHIRTREYRRNGF